MPQSDDHADKYQHRPHDQAIYLKHLHSDIPFLNCTPPILLMLHSHLDIPHQLVRQGSSNTQSGVLQRIRGSPPDTSNCKILPARSFPLLPFSLVAIIIFYLKYLAIALLLSFAHVPLHILPPDNMKSFSHYHKDRS